MQQQAEIYNLEEMRPIVKADIEKGYDRLAHDLTNALMVNNANLTAREMQVVFAVISKTYRFHKKEDWIANSQICDLTKMKKGHVSNLIKSLISKNVLYKNGRNLGINTLVSDWKVHNLVNSKSSQSNEQQFTTSCTRVHELMNKSSQPSETQKKEITTKEITTKEYSAGRKKKSTKIPSNFSLDQTMIDWANKNKINLDLKLETDQFIDHHLSKDSRFADWKRAWQTWMRNAKKFSQNKPSFKKNNRTPENFDTKDYGKAVVRF